VLCGHVPYHNFASEIQVVVATMEGIRPKKPENATDLGFTKPLWDTVKQRWLGDWRARPGVKDVLSYLNGVPLSWHRRQRVTILRRAVTTLFGDSR